MTDRAEPDSTIGRTISGVSRISGPWSMKSPRQIAWRAGCLHGNVYAAMRTTVGETWEGPISRETIAPRGVMLDLLIFAPPVDAASELRLEIPAAPLGGKGRFRFSLPRTMWQHGAEER